MVVKFGCPCLKQVSKYDEISLPIFQIGLQNKSREYETFWLKINTFLCFYFEGQFTTQEVYCALFVLTRNLGNQMRLAFPSDSWGRKRDRENQSPSAYLAEHTNRAASECRPGERR